MLFNTVDRVLDWRVLDQGCKFLLGRRGVGAQPNPTQRIFSKVPQPNPTDFFFKMP